MRISAPRLKQSALGLGLLFVVAQFWRPARNVSAAPAPNDIVARHAVPAPVQDLLHRACYDCHSDNTRYPWYAEVQPVRWWLDSHIAEGKRHLNFSEFGAYSASRAGKKLDQIIDEVEDHAMPLKSYTWAHADARLTPADIKLIADWADQLRDEIAP